MTCPHCHSPRTVPRYADKPELGFTCVDCLRRIPYVPEEEEPNPNAGLTFDGEPSFETP